MDRGETLGPADVSDASGKVQVWVDGVLGGKKLGI